MNQVHYYKQLNIFSFGKQLFHSAFHPLTTDICISSIYRPNKIFWRKEEPQHGKQLQKIMLGSSPFHEWFLLTSAELLIYCTFWGAVETTVVLTTPLVFKEVGQQRSFTHLYQGKEVKFCPFFFFFLNLRFKVHETAIFLDSSSITLLLTEVNDVLLIQHETFHEKQTNPRAIPCIPNQTLRCEKPQGRNTFNCGYLHYFRQGTIQHGHSHSALLGAAGMCKTPLLHCIHTFYVKIKRSYHVTLSL